MARRLDYRPKPETFAWLDQREEAFFAHYLECGRVLDVMDELRRQTEAEGWPISYETIYEWLKATDERATRWDEAKALRGYMSADHADQIAERATQQDANASRLKWDAKMRAAEWQNRAVFGKRPDVQIALGVGGEWSQALQAVLTTPDGSLAISSQSAQPAQPAQPDRPRPTAEGNTRAARAALPSTVGSSGEPSQAQGTPSHDET